jgi:streptogramin lyase
MKTYIKKTSLLPALIAGLGLTLADRVAAQSYDTNNVIVQTFAGAAIPGYLDGQGQLAKFSSPSEIVADTSGNLFVFDSGNQVIRKITTNGAVTTFVGGGNQFEGYGTNVWLAGYAPIGAMNIDHSNKIWFVGYIGGNTYLVSIHSNGYVSVENGGLPGMTYNSSRICFDSANNIYYNGGHNIYRYDPNTGVAQVFAGSGASGYVDGNGIFTAFSSPDTVVCDPSDNIYVLDQNGGRLRKIDQGQNVTTVATNIAGAPLAVPRYVDNSGNIVCVSGNGVVASYVSKITSAKNVLLFAGNTTGTTGYTNGAGNTALFNRVTSASLSQGSIFVADKLNHRIRQISFNPQPQIVTGANLGIATYPGVTITGAVGRTYQIQSSANVTNWTPIATILLPTSPYLWIDQNPVSGNKFYRALLIP